jgi:hypothetical protein
MPLETVIQLFKRLGYVPFLSHRAFQPYVVLQTYQTCSLDFMLMCCFIIRPRVILVEKLGSLVGLITVKDVLRFIAKEAEGRHHGAIHPTSGLEGTLEEAWVWLTERVRPLLHR